MAKMGKRVAKAYALKLAASYLRADSEETSSNLTEDGFTEDDADLVREQILMIAEVLDRQGDALEYAVQHRGRR